ncbi:MAG TPA: M23 family metallopeptidase [Patescibacteria group bacterium]
MNLMYPVENPDISQPFGEDNTANPKRNSFYTIFDNKHPGVDFKTPVGTTIFAAYPGIVVRREFHEGMGNVIGTRYGNIVILYAHLDKALVKLGQTVKDGDLIGLSGQTGEHCTHPHLHFEMRDITKKNLKEMVFKPEFGKPIKQLKDKFIYKVYNANTQKTLKFLSIRYFGNENYWKKILENNTFLDKDPEKIIPEKTEIVIPNY